MYIPSVSRNYLASPSRETSSNAPLAVLPGQIVSSCHERGGGNSQVMYSCHVSRPAAKKSPMENQSSFRILESLSPVNREEGAVFNSHDVQLGKTAVP